HIKGTRINSRASASCYVAGLRHRAVERVKNSCSVVCASESYIACVVVSDGGLRSAALIIRRQLAAQNGVVNQEAGEIVVRLECRSFRIWINCGKSRND